jgi:hypothetical protein
MHGKAHGGSLSATFVCISRGNSTRASVAPVLVSRHEPGTSPNTRKRLQKHEAVTDQSAAPREHARNVTIFKILLFVQNGRFYKIQQEYSRFSESPALLIAGSNSAWIMHATRAHTADLAHTSSSVCTKQSLFEGGGGDAESEFERLRKRTMNFRQLKL